MTKGVARFFDVDERLAELSAKGDDLERVKTLVDFEMFRAALEAAVPRGDRSKGGRPPFDHVFMFKILILQAMHSLSDERCEYLIKDRLSFMRFLGLGLADAVPDANTIWTFREALKKADAVDALFQQFDAALRDAGFLAMSGQIIDATIVAAPKQRNTNDEKKAIKEGRIPEEWKDKPKKLAQKDRDARWTIKYTKAKARDDASVPPVDLAIPAFGYKNHISIDRAHGLIRKWTATHAAAHDGARLEEVSIGPTRRARSMRIRPIARRRTRRCCRGPASSRAFIARSRRASRCRSARASPMRRNLKCAAPSSMCSRIRRG
jgi:IS5 family transposase